MWSAFDRQMMARALQLAKKGQYTTKPNPNVGCVITLNEQIIGEGFHYRAGEPHAEVHALRQAQNQSLGATAYVTLEPCSHFGRTPPCAQALIDAGISRVVVAAEDPHHQVAGKGIEMLRQAGIEVEIGLYCDQSRALSTGFMQRMETAKPRITVKVAASIDGKTALSNGVSQWITGAEARRDVQRLRLTHCAVITGINTVLDDDCSLTVRHSELGELANDLPEADIIQPIRVVLDSQCQMPLTAKLLSIVSPVILVSTKDYSDEFTKQLPEYVQCLTLKSDKGKVDLGELLQVLGQSCNSVLIEAGATLAGAFIEQGLADELWLYQAPKILGSAGRNMLMLPDFQQLSNTPSLTLLDERQIGSDRRFRFQLQTANR